MSPRYSRSAMNLSGTGRSAARPVVILLVVLAAVTASCGGGGSDTTTTAPEPDIVVTPIADIPYPRLDLIDRGLVTCVTTGVLALSDGSERSVEECQGEYAFVEQDFHVRQGWVRDAAFTLEALVDAGHVTTLSVDGVERPPTGHIDTWEDGTPFVGSYWVIEGMSGDHELAVRWYAEGQLFLTSTSLIHFPAP